MEQLRETPIRGKVIWVMIVKALAYHLRESQQRLTENKQRQRSNGNINTLAPQDRAVHDWYRFVLSYPAHLVRDYIERFELTENAVVLDPFCGTGTTLVECKKLGIKSIGIEANPFARFASRVKIDWRPHPDGLLEHAQRITQAARTELASQHIYDTEILDASAIEPLRNDGSHWHNFSDKSWKLLPKDAISPLPLHKVLTLRESIEKHYEGDYYSHELLALAKVAVQTASNLRFGPEIGVGTIKADAPIVNAWLKAIEEMGKDLRQLAHKQGGFAEAYLADARKLPDSIRSSSIDAVITSPPYPNEKDYTRITRLESVLLKFFEDNSSMRVFKRNLIRSNTRNVYKGDRDDLWVEQNRTIQNIANEIEARRIELGKTSGFEKLYGKVTKLYFGGMARHLAELRRVLRPGAQLAYVVGDQASYLRVMIRTGHLLGDIAQSLGYQLEGIDLFRTRLSTATREQLREEVVLLRWKGE